MRRLRAAAGMLTWIISLSLAGCGPAQPPATADGKTETDRADITDEAREVAETSLGKQAEVLAQGDLARDGREQVLAVNRISKGAASAAGAGSATAILVTRAAILEKNGGKWSQVLLCDEHLKNSNGYLGGSSAGRSSGWRLEFTQDAKEGLELRFTPAETFDAADENADQSSRHRHGELDVRWNKNAKRYQSFDQSHERYLSEVPSLVTPQSILK